MGQLEKIEEFLRDLFSCLQIARLYTTAHAQFEKALTTAYIKLSAILENRQELVIGIVGEELAFEKEILFDLSKSMNPVIAFLKKRGIEKITFLSGVQKNELTDFLEFLASKEEAKDLGLANISVGRIEAGKDPKSELSKAIGCLEVYENSSRNVFQSLESMLVKEAMNYLDLKASLRNIMEKFSGQHREILTLVTIKRYDVSTFIHSLNVAILAMYFSAKLGFAKEDCLDIGLAAVFHDIGKLYISRKIIGKPGKLTEEEFSQIRSHVILGAEMLLEHINNLGILPLVVSFEHHLGYDANGYPKLPFINPPHTASLIVSICDVYDALSQRRNYKNDYPPLMIYELMAKGKGSSFEPVLLEKFFRIMGVWPVGSIVSLSDGRIAVVREEDGEDIFLPRVEIISGAGKGEIISLKEVKGKLTIVQYLNPWKEGKAYLPLIREKIQH